MFKKSLIAVLALSAFTTAAFAEQVNIKMTTNKGVIELQLDGDKAPVTVKNFVEYADAGYYNNTIFHRVIPGFMIQGGGMTADMQEKQTREPIKNEAENGLKNVRGSIAMARTQDINSATSQFFINVADNAFLDNGTRDYGYAVFGQVTNGMDVVDAITKVETTNKAPHQNVPVEPVVIEKVEVIK